MPTVLAVRSPVWWCDRLEAERVPLPVGHLKRVFRHSDTSSTVTTTSGFTLVIGRSIHGLACGGETTIRLFLAQCFEARHPDRRRATLAARS